MLDRSGLFDDVAVGCCTLSLKMSYGKRRPILLSPYSAVANFTAQRTSFAGGGVCDL